MSHEGSRLHYAFDFDLTLAESAQGTIRCAQYALERLGFAIPDDTTIRRTIGLDLPSTFKALTQVDDDELAGRFKHLFGLHADEVMLDCIEFFDGVADALSILKQREHYVSIVSTKFGYRIRAALVRDGLDHLVDSVIGGDNVERTKPDPEGLLAVIDMSQVPATDTAYIGDSATDGECARRAGVPFIAVTTGETDRKQLLAFDPVAVLDDISDIVTCDLPNDKGEGIA
jgi:phosphoglycolate phosphatase